MTNDTRHIQLALYRGKSVISKAIKWISWGQYSHVSIRLPEENGVNYESWDGVGVRKCKSISDGHTKGTPVDLYQLDVTPEQYAKIIAALDSQLGKKYDFKGVFRFVPFLRLFMSDQPSTSEQGKWFCSEYAIWAIAQASINLLNVEPWKVPPSDIPKSPLLVYVGTLVTV